MPSPIGHSLVGAALAVVCLMRRDAKGPLVRRVWNLRWPLLGCALLANAPDLDFVPGLLVGNFNAFHHGYSHSLGWVLLFSTSVWWMGKGCGQACHAGTWAVILAVVLSHLVADFLCEDGSPPYGVMFFWPLHDGWYVSPISVFAAMKKDTVAAVFQWSNLGPACREMVIGFLLFGSMLAWKSRTPRAEV